MSRGIPSFLSTLSIALALGASATAQARSARVNCEAPHQQQADLAPTTRGPLALAAIYCQRMPSSTAPAAAALVSSDAQSIAYYEPSGLVWVARLDRAAEWTSYPAAHGTFAHFGGEPRNPPALAWSSGSQSPWLATHDRVEPSGFAVSPLRVVRTGLAGALVELPRLEHPAGSLDALLWANGEGLAVAQFGSRGGRYRPEHSNHAPTLAIVDVARGHVLDAVPFAAIPALSGHGPGAAHAAIKGAAAQVLADGRVRAVLRAGSSWVIWIGGEAPRVLRDPYDGEAHVQMALAPDGSAVLIGRLLRTEGGVCGRVGGCRPGRPVEGVLAAAHDPATGEVRWALRGTATADHEFPAPAISPDGRHALIGLMAESGKVSLALVAMADGRIVQRLPAPGVAYAMGFARGGKTVWSHALGLTALYEFGSPSR